MCYWRGRISRNMTNLHMEEQSYNSSKSDTYCLCACAGKSDANANSFHSVTITDSLKAHSSKKTSSIHH